MLEKIMMRNNESVVFILFGDRRSVRYPVLLIDSISGITQGHVALYLLP